MSKFVWHYKRADFIAINAELNSVDWEKAFHELGDVDQATDFILNNIKASAYRHIPYRKVNIRTRDKPWMTSYIKHLIRLRDRWSKVYNKKPTNHNKVTRNAYRNMVKSEIKLAKACHYDRQAKLLGDSITNPKRYWTLVKSLLGNKVTKKIPTLREGSCLYQTDLEKAEHLNDYFYKQSVLELTPDTDRLPEFEYVTDKRLSDFTITEEQVIKVLQSLNEHKASGPDGIGNKLLKILPQVLPNP